MLDLFKKNQDIFKTLLNSGRYLLTRDTKNPIYIKKAYDFFKTVDITDDANVSDLQYNLDDFNREGEPAIEDIINEFNTWLQSKVVKMAFYTEYEKKIQREETELKTLHREVLHRIEEIGVKRRTMKRTSKIKMNCLI